MIPLASLWLPIVLSAVAVFFGSSLVHMVIGYHKHDFDTIPAESDVLDALRKFNLPKGDYHAPHPSSMAELKDPAFIAKTERGPVVLLRVFAPNRMAIGPRMAKWFVFCVIVGLFSAYIAAVTLQKGAPYLTVFRVVGAATFMGYGLGGWPETIWYDRKTGTTVRNTIDALIYALLTAGVFGWLWPK
ncbi:MAG TPA: hypothetical protein VE967_00740 [Gemmatimonadaceae bacterium]|nr:hypothetical protein [Gemmatimonadaceae bacterium]